MCSVEPQYVSYTMCSIEEHIVYPTYTIGYHQIGSIFPVSILYKSIAGCYRPVRVADGPITARKRFIKNASWVCRVCLIPTQYASWLISFNTNTIY